MIYSLIKNFIPIPAAIKSRVDGDFLVVCSSTLEIYYLNGVARDFYLQMDGQRSLECIYKNIFEEYDVDSSTLQHDLTHLLRDLQWQLIAKLRSPARTT
jgi:hypothetical protein